MRRQEMSLLLGVLVAALLREAGAATCATGTSSQPLCSNSSCNGQCSEAAGCYCPGNYLTCLPSVCSLTSGNCCPLGLFWHSDISCCSGAATCATGTSSHPLCSNSSCNGQCSEAAGCFCPTNYLTCLPSVCSLTSGNCCPLGFFWHSDISCCSGESICTAGNSTWPLCSNSSCNGQCIEGVGCYCVGGDTCLPSVCNSATTQCCPVGLYWHSDFSCCSGVLNCEPACVSDEVCTDNAGIGECICDPSKYLHANRSQIIPTIECEGSAMTVSLRKCLLKRFKYSISGMHFTNASGDGCTDPSYEALIRGERWIRAQAIPQKGSCGTVMTINDVDKKLTFSNALYVPPETSGGLAVSSTLNISFSCTYNMTMQTSLQTVLHPIIGTVTLPSVNGSGPITATMAAYMTNAFTTPYTQGNTLTVGDPLYIGISTAFSDGDVFTLRAEKCVAAPTNNPLNTGVLLISGGCAVTEDVDVQIIHNGDSLEVMFQIATFAFKDQSEVYMSCDVSLCPKTTPNNCGCSSSRSAPPETATIQMDPIGISASLTFNSGSHTDISLWAVLGSSLLALLSLKMI